MGNSKHRTSLVILILITIVFVTYVASNLYQYVTDIDFRERANTVELEQRIEELEKEK